MTSADAASALEGRWGAKGAVLSVGPTRSQIDLGHGDIMIDGAIKADRQGRFTATGLYRAYRPGPEHVDARPTSTTVQVEGQIVGDAIELTTRLVGAAAVQRYRFAKGAQAKIHRML